MALPNMKKAFANTIATRVTHKLPPFLFSGAKYFIAQLGGALLAFIALPILTRIYSPDIYGQYLLILSAVSLVNVAAVQWLQQSTLRFLPGSSQAVLFERQIASTTAFLATIVVFTSLLFLPLLPGLDIPPASILLVALYGALTSAASIQASIRQALEKGWIFAGYLFVQGVVPLALAIAFSIISPNLISLLLAQVLGAFLALVIVIRFVGFSLPSKQLLKTFLTYGLPLSMWIISAQVLSHLDRFMIAYYLDVKAAGIYAINYNIVVSLQSLLFAPLLLAVHPLLMKLWNSEDPNYRATLQQAMHVFIILAVLALSFFTLCHQYVGQILLGDAFREGTVFMPFIAMGHIAWGFAAYLNKSFEFRQETSKMALLALLSAVVNFALNALFIPVYGPIAAAWTTVVSYVAYLMGTYWFSHKMVRVLPHVAVLIPVFCVSVAMAIIYGLLTLFQFTFPVGNMFFVALAGVAVLAALFRIASLRGVLFDASQR